MLGTGPPSKAFFLNVGQMFFPQELGLVNLSLFFFTLARTQEVQAENVTVAEGGQAEINCKLHQYDGSIVVIQNPSRQTLFFNGTRGNLVSSLQGVELWAGDGMTEPQRPQHLESGSSTFLLSLRVDLQCCPGLETRSVQNCDCGWF